MSDLGKLFGLDGKVAIVTGGTGVLGGAMAQGLAIAGATVGILGRNAHKAKSVISKINAMGGEAFPLLVDVLDKNGLLSARDKVVREHGHIDILVNAAGGNIPGATIFGDVSFFEMTRESYESVLALNLTGTVSCCQAFGEAMAQQAKGSIINISSMAAQTSLTRVLGYGNAKAAVDNLTKWLAVELAQKYGPDLRVNAIAPGFFIGEQNRSFLLNDDGTHTARGQQIVDHTPLGRYGEPDELVGTVIWLASDGSRFVTGAVIPVDGGFSAYSGV